MTFLLSISQTVAPENSKYKAGAILRVNFVKLYVCMYIDTRVCVCVCVCVCVWVWVGGCVSMYVCIPHQIV